MSPVEFFTLFVTVVGWLVVYRTQKSIQEQARNYQRRDRDLSVYRARMGKASRLTRTLIETSDIYYKFGSLADATAGEGAVGETFFRIQGEVLIREVPKAALELAIILYDPEYRVLRNLLAELNEEKSKELYSGIRAQAAKAADFSTRAGAIKWGGESVQEDLEYLAEKGHELGDEQTALANIAGDGFARLDEVLASNGEPKHIDRHRPNIFRAWFEWMLIKVLRDDYIPPQPINKPSE